MSAMHLEKANVSMMEDRHSALRIPVAAAKSLEDDASNMLPPSSTRRGSSSGFLNAWDDSVEAHVRTPLRRGIVFCARTAALHPGQTILLSLLLSIALVVTGWYTNFEIETDSFVLWTPTGSLPQQHGDWVDHDSGFPAPTRDFYFIVHSNGDNVLTQAKSLCLLDAIDTIRGTAGYEETCLQSWGVSECPIVAASKLFHHNRTELTSQVESDEDVQRVMSSLVYPDDERVVRSYIFGYPQPELARDPSGLSDEEDLLLQSALSYLGTVLLDPEAEISEDLEKAATDALYDLNERWANDHVQCVVEVNSARSFDDELIRGIFEDSPYMAVAFLLMGAFCAAYLSKRKSCVMSQSVVGLGAVFTVGVSIMTGYGLLFCFGVPFSSVTQIFPYIMVGVGLVSEAEQKHCTDCRLEATKSLAFVVCALAQC